MSTQDERQIIPFAQVLQQVARGAAHNKLSELLADLAAAVHEHQKAGTLTIAVKIEPTKGTETLTVMVTSTMKAPQATEASIFFSDETGNLTRHDPRQLSLPLRDASGLMLGKETA